MDDAEFEEILAGLQAGRRRAISCLYGTFNPLLVRFLGAQAPGMGEDLAQETWLAATPKLLAFRGDQRAFRLWLVSLARDQLTTYRQSSVGMSTNTMDPRTLCGVAASRLTDDLRVADAAIAELLAGLPHIQAEVLLLRVVGGLSAQETGALVGKSAGAVRVIQHRALHHLAQRLADQRVRQ